MECDGCGRNILGYPCLWCDYNPESYQTYGEATSVRVYVMGGVDEKGQFLPLETARMEKKGNHK